MFKQWFYLMICVVESCDGTNASCPADTLFQPSNTTCRDKAGVCDIPENCTGSSAACPADALAPSSLVCRDATGVCDVAATCSGFNASCPANPFKPAAFVCRSATGVCDSPATCTGDMADCPANPFKPPSVECRGATGVCDVAATCTGSNASCPANPFKPAAFVCRSATGVCDVAELCTGANAHCPADQFQPVTTLCNSAGASGVCAPAVYCNGRGLCSAVLAASSTDGLNCTTDFTGTVYTCSQQRCSNGACVQSVIPGSCDDNTPCTMDICKADGNTTFGGVSRDSLQFNCDGCAWALGDSAGGYQAIAPRTGSVCR